MKISKTSPSIFAVAVGLLALLSTQPGAAYGAGSPGGMTAGIAGAASGASGGGHSGGGHAAGGAAPSSGGHVAASGSFHGGATGLHAINPTMTGVLRPAPGGSAPTASGPSRPASAVTVNRPVTATQPTTTASPRLHGVTRPTNAWTDTETNARATADLQNRSAQAYRQYIANGNYAGLTTPEGSTGSVLYPGAYGSALNSYYNHLGPNGTNSANGHARSFAHEDRWYGPNARYHRYWANGYTAYLGGYLGYPYLGAYGLAYAGGISEGDSLLGNNDGMGVTNPVATTEAGSPADADSPAVPASPDTQAAPVSRSKTAENADTALGNGPDSLIEAVQGELARLGYYKGKVDAIYRPDTREALRRFQNDQGLKATGRVNEATLHALQLD